MMQEKEWVIFKTAPVLAVVALSSGCALAVTHDAHAVQKSTDLLQGQSEACCEWCMQWRKRGETWFILMEPLRRLLRIHTYLNKQQSFVWHHLWATKLLLTSRTNAILITYVCTQLLHVFLSLVDSLELVSFSVQILTDFDQVSIRITERNISRWTLTEAAQLYLILHQSCFSKISANMLTSQYKSCRVKVNHLFWDGVIKQKPCHHRTSSWRKRSKAWSALSGDTNTSFTSFTPIHPQRYSRSPNTTATSTKPVLALRC